MSDNYQAVYDAVRSCFSYCNADQIIRDAVNIDASWAIEQVRNEYLNVTYELQRPSAIFKPELSLLSGRWIANLGDCEGIGESPEEAMRAFDVAWSTKV